MANFKLSNKAETDLKEIYQYGYHQHGESQAEHYIKKLEQTFNFLVENPLAAAERVEFKPPVRIHQHKQHLIIYIQENEDIFIIRLLHKRMDIRNHL